MRRLWRHQFRPTTLWLLLFLGVLAGLGLSRTGWQINGWYCWLVLPFLLFSLPKRRLVAICCIIVFGVLIGWWRGAVYLSRLSIYTLPSSESVTVTVTALDDAVYDTHQQLTFDASRGLLDDGQPLPGKLQISGFDANAVYAGDTVEVTGKLYPGYGAYVGQISFAQLDVVAHHDSLVNTIRRKFTAGMQTALPEPLAPFAMGLLVGQRATLPANVKQDLLMVGLTHIIAVSGYNLTIILHASKRLLGKRSKRVSTFLSLALIGVFLLLAGSSASIIRAAIVSVLSIAASYYGRSFKPLNLIALAAAITAWANPVYLWSDLSWYLSFLAFFGVMVVSPLIQTRWPGRWHETLIGGVALESICAETMSLPYILHVFGQLSLIGLPANVLVVTLVPLAMLLSLFAGLAGMLAGAVCGWIALPARLLLNYMLDTAHLLATVPHIFVQNRSLSLLAMLGLYSLVVGLVVLLTHKTKQARYATITDRNQPNNED
jgi:competence protein ComEC